MLQGLVAPQHVGSSWTGDRTCVFCIGRWTLYHWATREAPRNPDLTPVQSNRNEALVMRCLGGKNEVDRISDMFDQLKNNIEGHIADSMEHSKQANFMTIES